MLKKNGHIESHGQLLTSCTATKLLAEIPGQVVAGVVDPAALAAAAAAFAAAEVAVAFCWVLARREQTLFLQKDYFMVTRLSHGLL